MKYRSSSVNRSDSFSLEFKSQLGHVTSVEVDHEIFSTVIIPDLSIQKGQLSVTSGPGQLLRRLSQPVKSVLNMTDSVEWAVKLPSTQVVYPGLPFFTSHPLKE